MQREEWKNAFQKKLTLFENLTLYHIVINDAFIIFKVCFYTYLEMTNHLTHWGILLGKVISLFPLHKFKKKAIHNWKFNDIEKSLHHTMIPQSGGFVA